MQVSKKQQALAGVLGLATFALLADQLLPDPDGAEAALQSPLMDARQVEESAGATAALEQRPRIAAFAEALDAASLNNAATMNHTPDAFDCSSWIVAEAEPEQAAPGIDLLAHFDATHRLTSVIVGSPGAAMVGDSLVQVGGELDGFRLLEVGLRSATFESEIGRVTLVLPEDG